MTKPQIGLPTLCYIHPAILRGMAATQTPSHVLVTSKLDRTEQMLTDIKLRVAEMRRRSALIDVDDKEIMEMVKKIRDLTRSV